MICDTAKFLMSMSITNTVILLQIAKDARECVQECVSEFISFITSEASERCHQEKRKTINGEDILFAMTNLGFDNYIESLKIYLQKYREVIFFFYRLIMFKFVFYRLQILSQELWIISISKTPKEKKRKF